MAALETPVRAAEVADVNTGTLKITNSARVDISVKILLPIIVLVLNLCENVLFSEAAYAKPFLGSD